ncbi:MAG: hypothetical protein QF441_02175, partial [Bacteriovoracaceae bacterium]|nr:hypothetical protein [Bacteriovoracaceae bacterium]
MDTSSGVLDTAFGDGDGSPNDGIVQLNATNTGDASSGDFIQSIVLDGAGNLFAGGDASSSLGGVSQSSFDTFTIMISAGDEGL